MSTVDTNRCNGTKPDGQRCGMTRMTNFAGKKAVRFTPQPYFCSRHRDQQDRQQEVAS